MFSSLLHSGCYNPPYLIALLHLLYINNLFPVASCVVYQCKYQLEHMPIHLTLCKELFGLYWKRSINRSSVVLPLGMYVSIQIKYHLMFSQLDRDSASTFLCEMYEEIHYINKILQILWKFAI